MAGYTDEDYSKAKVTAGTVARTVILAVALFNQIMTAAGYSILPIADDTINQLVSALFTTGAAVAAWWKNNSFTDAAIRADVVKDIKQGGGSYGN